MDFNFYNVATAHEYFRTQTFGTKLQHQHCTGLDELDETTRINSETMKGKFGRYSFDVKIRMTGEMKS